MALDHIVDENKYPLGREDFQTQCRKILETEGALVFPGFLKETAIVEIHNDGKNKQSSAYFCEQRHNVYLTPSDPDYPTDHIRNHEVVTTKGCITDDQVPDNSPLRELYDSDAFKHFLCEVLGEQALHPYADPLSSINLHFTGDGQELGWHFDNSSFAITLMIQSPDDGGSFDYIKDLRNADTGDMNFGGVKDALAGEIEFESLSMPAGTLVLFRGRNSLHRVAPVKGNTTRMLAVLAYNSKSGISLSENARMTFFGRLN
ncbi:arpA protein [Alphaproteobacteria bacterium 46_93_T64]|nr:arpA protein [Alphaproteobacteria bacterium 46_93_T64]